MKMCKPIRSTTFAGRCTTHPDPVVPRRFGGGEGEGSGRRRFPKECLRNCCLSEAGLLFFFC